MAIRQVVIPWTTIFTNNTSSPGDFNACTVWMEGGPFKEVRVTFEVQNTTDSSAVISPAFQTANVDDTILATTIFPASSPTRNDQTGDGLSFPNGYSNLQSGTEPVQQVRFGFYFDGDTAGLQCARVQAVIEYKDC